MPILPLDHPEPLTATLGIMLYPGIGAVEAAKARAFVGYWLAKPLRQFHAAGHRLNYEKLAQIAESSGELLDDLDTRWWCGTAVGEVIKAFFILTLDNPSLASWNNATRIATHNARRSGGKSSRSEYNKARSQMATVAHLWGAWSIREGRFETKPDIGYDGFADFQSFLAEAEYLRDWGQNWRPTRTRGSSPLPSDVWRVPDDWRPPPRQPDWPITVPIPGMTLPADLLALLKPAGRPRKISS